MDYRLSSLLSTSNYIPVNKILVMKLGPLEAMMFGELCSESDYWHEHNGITEDGYFFSTVDNIENKLNIKRKLQEKIVKSLASAGLLSVSKRGMPAKRYIKINEEKLLNLLVPKGLTSTDHWSQQVRTIGPTNNTISNNTIKNNTTTSPPASSNRGKKSSDFLPPTLEQVKKYIEEKKYNIDPEYFFNYYSADDWKDRNNKPIKNWKLKAFTWHNKNPKSSNPIIEEVKAEPTVFDDNFWSETRKKQDDYLQQIRERRLKGGTNK